MCKPARASRRGKGVKGVKGKIYIFFFFSVRGIFSQSRRDAETQSI